MARTDHIRPRRSCLYMPGANPRALEKAKSLSADTLILDLEDSVSPEVKQEARKVVYEKVTERVYGKREVVIRINGLNTDWGEEDLRIAVEARPDAILAPKVTSADDIFHLDERMSKAGASHDIHLWVMIEMPLAILNIKEISQASQKTRLRCFVMGTNDLAKEYGARLTDDRLAFQTQLILSITAARSFDLTAIDGVFNDLKNDEGLKAECQQGRNFGFDGKTLIHPSQLDITNQVFTPDEEEVSHAKCVIEAFAAPENKGKGVIKVNGKMTELLHLEQAKQLVAISNAISSL